MQPLPSQIEPLGSLGIRCPASVVATSDYIFVIRGMFAHLRRLVSSEWDSADTARTRTIGEVMINNIQPNVYEHLMHSDNFSTPARA